MNERKSKRISLISTTILHLIAFACLLSFTFTPPDPPFPEPSGVEVNLGEEVIGSDVPGDPNMSEDVLDNNQNVIPQNQTPQPQIQDNLLTQKSDDDNPVHATSKPIDKKPVETKPVLTPEEQLKIQQQEAFMKQQQALASKNLKGTPGNGGTNTGQWGNSDKGKTSGTPGNPNGTVSKNTRGTPGNPFGNGDAVYMPKPTNTLNCNKLVTLYVKINSAGQVISIIRPETAESDQACIDAAKKVAMQTRYKPDPTVEVRYGKINYDYTTSQK